MSSSSQENTGSVKVARRLVLLVGDTESAEVEQVLRDYAPGEVSGSRLHADLQDLAANHRGRYVAAEWLSALGWVRFLWCRR